jgi:hypothetical protein
MAIIQNNQRTCIFCAERGVNSKEHFFPEWLPAHVKEWETKAHAIVRVTEDVNRANKKRTAKETYGPLATRKIRCVCTVCNGGWMSQAEQKAMPHLESMLSGRATPLKDDAVSAIAHWIAIKTIVSEHGDRATIVTPQDIRSSVMQGVVPDCFNIYIGAHHAQNMGFCRTSHTVGLTADALQPDANGAFTKNVQQVTFTVGRFFAVVNVCLVPGVDMEKISGYVGFYELSKIWPDRKFVIWPPVQPLTATQLNELATSIHTATGGSPFKAIL